MFKKEFISYYAAETVHFATGNDQKKSGHY